ncbi:hypothetical protein ACFFGV_17535 [Pontibacillus salicampi]|uniref:Uncharacterized protein n=1 Tax=Pontibacillus salicampi TaxID=1449801 RepID=A0ABV6LT05_9BACI
MRPRVGRSLFSLAVLIFIIGLVWNEDFWTLNPGEETPEKLDTKEEVQPDLTHDHNNPKRSPLDLEEAPAPSEASPDEDILSLVVMEDQPSASLLTLLTFDKGSHTLYVSKQEEEISEDTESVVQQLEQQMNLSIPYYIRVDQGELEAITKEALDIPALQQLAGEQLTSAGDVSEVNVGSIFQDVSQLSFSTLLSLQQLAVDIQQRVDTNLSVSEVLALQAKLGLESLTEPVEIQEGLYGESVPTIHEPEPLDIHDI